MDVTPALGADMPAPSLAPKQERSRRSYDRILDAAGRVLAAGGAEGFTIQAIAQEAGVSIGGIYRRFQDRAEILVALKARVLDGLVTPLIAAIEQAGPGLADILETLIRVLAREFARSEPVHAHIDAQAAQAPRITEIGIEQNDRVWEALRRATAPHRAEIAHADPEAALRIAFDVVNRTVVTEVRAEGQGRMSSRLVSPFPRIVDELVVMTYGYLVHPMRPAAGAQSAATATGKSTLE